jgi:putative transposase
MAYGLDLRQKVIDYIENGGRVSKAAQVFGMGRASIYRWLERKELAATKVKYRQRSLDIRELSKDIQENPEARLKQRAEKFGVSKTAIFKALKKMKITRKKRSRKERIKYYQDLRKLVKIYGSKSLVFVDESGFEESPDCTYARSKRGKKIYGDRQGKRGKRENLVAGRRKGKKI